MSISVALWKFVALIVSTCSSDKKQSRKPRSSASLHKNFKRTTPTDVERHHLKTTANQSPHTTRSTVKITNGYSDDSNCEDESKGSWVQTTSAYTNTSPGLFSSPLPSSTTVNRRRSLRSAQVADKENTSGSLYNSHDQEHLDSLNTKKGNSSLPYQTFENDLKNGGDVYRRQALSRATLQKNLNHDEKSEEINKQKDASMPSKTLFSKLLRRFTAKEGDSKPDESSFPQSHNPSRRSWLLHCSILIPLVTIGFFIILGLVYVTMRTDDSAKFLEGSLAVSKSTLF